MRLDVIEPWGELILIALAVGQAVRDDDLRRAIHRSLRVIGLNEPVLALHDAAFGIGEVALRLAVRGAARRPRLLTWLLAPRRPALLAGAAADALASASSAALASRILASRFALSATQSGN